MFIFRISAKVNVRHVHVEFCLVTQMVLFIFVIHKLARWAFALFDEASEAIKPLRSPEAPRNHAIPA